MVTKYFILDTNILLNSPSALYSFEDNTVVITEAVLEELDNFKKNKDDIGVNARQVTRSLEQLRQKGNLLEGVEVNDKHGILKIEVNHRNIQLPDNWRLDKADHRILQVCKALKDEQKDARLITNDILLRIKSDIIGVPAESFETEQAPAIDSQYTGRIETYISEQDFENFYNNGELILANTKLFYYDDHGNQFEYKQPLYPNEFIILRNPITNTTALGMIDSSCSYIYKLQYDNTQPYGIIPKNVAQRFMIEAVMSDIPLTILKGPAGTAKTLISLAAGLERVSEKNEFRRVLLCRPAVAMGEDLGYLPGDEKEKISPYMRSALDNLEILVDSNEKDRYNSEYSLQSKIQYILDKGYIDMQAVSFLRGRSISKQYVILDECLSGKCGILLGNKMTQAIESLYDDFIKGKSMPTVMTVNETTNKCEPKKIVNIVKKGYRDVYLIKTAHYPIRVSYQNIICTGNHPFLTKYGWCRADQLQIDEDIYAGTYITGDDISLRQVVSITRLPEQEIVYDMEVEDNHNFMVVNTTDQLEPYHGGMEGIIVHNCQNLSVSQAKAIVTRVGEGTKLIMCGDPYQIDAPFLDSTNNGLSWLSEKMKGSQYCVQITAKNSECVRSKLAEDAINRLN